MRLRSRIGVLIDDSKYSREDMMREFKRGRNTISNWCTGKSFPSVPEVWRLAEMLGVEVGELYAVEDWAKHNEEKAPTE
ncbi:helix-turn-helix transcriptional regulator [Bacillus sp. MCCB 382]|uniref:helix-turn-helix transcriptional regulator n=1 Tax=Bacillus sp. MCCB 382 TaxID=2860197 RepID=UPI00280AC56D